MQTAIQAVPKALAVERVRTNAGAPIQQVGAIVMETTSALAVVPAGQVDTAGVVVALDEALCTLVDICGQTCSYQDKSARMSGQKNTKQDKNGGIVEDIVRSVCLIGKEED